MLVFRKITALLERVFPFLRAQRLWRLEVESELEDLKILSARLFSSSIASRNGIESLADVEFKAFSQFGDDGILQYLTQILDIQNKSFIEFGVESYREANTRLLLIKDNWRGLIIDGSTCYMEKIKAEKIYWRNDLTAVAAFIDRDNINSIITQNGFSGDLGLLSVDIDGNDYWVWERIDCVNPIIVVAEYNAVFGCDRAVSVPYKQDFIRSDAHYSNLYWGCSLQALVHLAVRKGYTFIGCNSHGNNAYFVRNDYVNKVKTLAACAKFVNSKFRESRDEQGRLTFLSGSKRAAIIADLPLIDVKSGATLSVGQL